MSNFVQVTPFLAVDDLDRALAFFTDLLGFRTLVHGGGYAYVEREGVGFRLLRQGPGNLAAPGTRRFAHYIDVRDVDAVYAELGPKLAALPLGDVRGPVNQPHGQRELMVLAPDGNFLVFGQAIAGADVPAH